MGTLSEEFRIGASGQESVTCLQGFGLKVHVASEPNLAPLPARTTPKPGDLAGLGSHEQGSKTALQRGGMGSRQSERSGNKIERLQERGGVGLNKFLYLTTRGGSIFCGV